MRGACTRNHLVQFSRRRKPCETAGAGHPAVDAVVVSALVAIGPGGAVALSGDRVMIADGCADKESKGRREGGTPNGGFHGCTLL